MSYVDCQNLDDSHKANEENQAEPDFFFQGELQMPNDWLRQYYDCKIGHCVDDSSRYVRCTKIETTSFDLWINSWTPTFFDRFAVEYRQKDVDGVVDKVQPYQSSTCPEHCIVFDRRENPLQLK